MSNKPLVLRTKNTTPDRPHGDGHPIGEKHGLVWSPNAWNFDLTNLKNFINMEIGEDYFDLEVSQQTDVGNFSHVSAYPTGGLGSFGGRYMHNGRTTAKILKLEGVRGSGGMQTPVFDMREISKIAAGIPCFLRDFPDQVDVHVRRKVVNGKLIVNSFMDMYLNDVDHERFSGIYTGTLNGPAYNETKAWNFNYWFDLPFMDNPGTSKNSVDGGWSGGKIIYEFKLMGIDHVALYKRETAGQNGNNFNLVAVVPKARQAIEHLDVVEYKDAMLNTDWVRLIKAKGLEPVPHFGNPHEGMVLCGLQGPGAEVWSGKGKLRYDKFAIVVNGEQRGFGAPEIENRVEEPTEEESKGKTETTKIELKPPTQGEKEERKRTKNITLTRLHGKRTPLPQSNGGGRITDLSKQGIISGAGDFPSIFVIGIGKGVCDVSWTCNAGGKFITSVEVNI